MKLQNRSREEPEINVISLVDVLLVLVLFLMVSTTFMRETEISLQLPEATTQTPAVPVDDKLEIMITQANAYVDRAGRRVPDEALASASGSAGASPSQPTSRRL